MTLMNVDLASSSVSLTTYQTRIEQVLSQYFSARRYPCSKLQKAIEYSVFSGGKRFRPLLVYLTGSIFNLPLPLLDEIAISIELIHTYSLIHDDLPAMDDDALRRGKPTCHKQFDEATAILAGDALQTLAFEVLAHSQHLSAPIALKLIKLLIEASGPQGMIAGQALDLSADKTIDILALQTIHELKTGALIKACVLMPICSNNNTLKYLKTFETFAMHLGLAFQMQDDYRDRYATSLDTGKRLNSDLKNDKTTYATLMSEKALKSTYQKSYQSAISALQSLPLETQMLKDFCVKIAQR